MTWIFPFTKEGDWSYQLMSLETCAYSVDKCMTRVNWAGLALFFQFGYLIKVCFEWMRQEGQEGNWIGDRIEDLIAKPWPTVCNGAALSTSQCATACRSTRVTLDQFH